MKHKLTPQRVARINAPGHATLWEDAETIFVQIIKYNLNESGRSKLAEFKHRVQSHAANTFQVKVIASKGEWISWWNELVDKLIEEQVSQ